MTMQPNSGPRGRCRPFAIPAALLAIAALVFAVSAWPPPLTPREHAIATALAGPAPADAVVADADRPAPPEPAVERTEAPAPEAAPLPTFEQLIERLVAIGQRTAQLARDDEIDAATASDSEARAVLTSLLQRFHDAGERALAMLAGVVEPTADGDDPARRIVLQVVLAAELARRREQALANADHSRIDPLVESVLTVMPQTPATTEVGARLLDGKPFLRGVHERPVFDLVQLAADGEFPRDVAIRLLSTLWDNLQRTGERSSDELSRLAMLLLADDDDTRRVVACRQLLADDRFRPLALAWLREHGDIAIATEIAKLAALDLEPAIALQVLRELAPVLRRATGAYMVLGTRAPGLVADTYRELLAANLQPDVRTDLVASVGLTGSEHAREVVQLALHDDPSPEVRLQAAFVLTATGAGDAGERALHQLLDDPAIANEATHLEAIVLAMKNLEADGAVNQIDRLAQRLRLLPLGPRARQSLDAMLVRSLPGGQVSAPGAGTDPR